MIGFVAPEYPTIWPNEHIGWTAANAEEAKDSSLRSTMVNAELPLSINRATKPARSTKADSQAHLSHFSVAEREELSSIQKQLGINAVSAKLVERYNTVAMANEWPPRKKKACVEMIAHVQRGLAQL